MCGHGSCTAVFVATATASSFSCVILPCAAPIVDAGRKPEQQQLIVYIVTVDNQSWWMSKRKQRDPRAVSAESKNFQVFRLLGFLAHSLSQQCTVLYTSHNMTELLLLNVIKPLSYGKVAQVLGRYTRARNQLFSIL
jgi:hypothetical protein